MTVGEHDNLISPLGPFKNCRAILNLKAKREMTPIQYLTVASCYSSEPEMVFNKAGENGGDQRS
jgi:hypothetical protein